MEKCIAGPDLFDDLYTDTDDASVPGIEGLNELIYRNERTKEPDLYGLPSPPPSDEEPSTKKKVTYYLSEKVLVELCDAKAKIKVLVPNAFKAKVSMSRIVDYAVNAILEEFKCIGKDSKLVRDLIEG